jgi:hypothetical protein
MNPINTLQAASALSVLNSLTSNEAKTSSGDKPTDASSGKASSGGASAAATNSSSQIQTSVFGSQASAAGHAALVSSLQTQEAGSSAIFVQGDMTYYYWRPRTIGEVNSTVKSEAAMTSSQLSDAFYSGKGLDGGSVRSWDIAEEVQDQEWTSEGFAAAGDQAKATFYKNMSTGIAAAFANHTLRIQNASDIPGLVTGQVEQLLGPSDESHMYASGYTGGQELQYDVIQDLIKSNPSTNFQDFAVGGVIVLLSWPKSSDPATS